MKFLTRFTQMIWCLFAFLAKCSIARWASNSASCKMLGWSLAKNISLLISLTIINFPRLKAHNIFAFGIYTSYRVHSINNSFLIQIHEFINFLLPQVHYKLLLWDIILTLRAGSSCWTHLFVNHRLESVVL